MKTKGENDDERTGDCDDAFVYRADGGGLRGVYVVRRMDAGEGRTETGGAGAVRADAQACTPCSGSRRLNGIENGIKMRDCFMTVLRPSIKPMFSS